MRSDAGMPGAILSCKVVTKHGFSRNNCVTKSKQISTVEGEIKNFKNQRTKSRETREQLKSCETREVPYTCRYASGHAVYATKAKLGSKCPLVYLQVYGTSLELLNCPLVPLLFCSLIPNRA